MTLPEKMMVEMVAWRYWESVRECLCVCEKKKEKKNERKGMADQRE